ncbi:adenylate/guanylate cyclase domain-containing protein [Citricoccus nitrophenolicus]
MYPTIESSVYDIFNAPWNITNGTVVPETEAIVMKNGGRRVDATYLYADLAGSSKLAHTMQKETTARIIRAYVNTAVRILRYHGGEIRSFDGDRVMAIFMGHSKNNDAVRTALAINWAVQEVIAPAIEKKWTDVSKNYTIGHGIGIDTGEVSCCGDFGQRIRLISTLPLPTAGNCSGLRWDAGSRALSGGAGCCKTPRCKR